MVLLGADVDALVRAATTFDEQADHVRSTAAVVARQLAVTWWQGGDARTFAARWSTEHAPALRRIATVLAERSTELRRQAEQQRTTSASGAGSALGVAGAAGTVAFVPQRDGGDADQAGQTLTPAEQFEHPEVVGPSHPYGELPTEAELAHLRELYATWLTDETIDGKPVLDIGNAEDFNALANFANPNTVYRFGDVQWTTDEQGRVIRVEGRIELDPVGRNDPDLQSDIGNEGYETDVGFHLIADRFAGQTNRLNVVPGNGFPTGDGLPNLNNGAYKDFENTLAALAEDHDVEVRITPVYDRGNDTNRPDSIIVEYRVDGGRWIEDEFVNKH